MDNTPQTSSGPIWTFSSASVGGASGVVLSAASSGTLKNQRTSSGVGRRNARREPKVKGAALRTFVLLKMGGQPLADMIDAPQQQPSPKGADHGT